jgi:hypothetical protein
MVACFEGAPIGTSENRGRYDRSKLRYPRDVTDDELKLVEPLMPAGEYGGAQRTVITCEG